MHFIKNKKNVTIFDILVYTTLKGLNANQVYLIWWHWPSSNVLNQYSTVCMLLLRLKVRKKKWKVRCQRLCAYVFKSSDELAGTPESMNWNSDRLSGTPASMNWNSDKLSGSPESMNRNSNKLSGSPESMNWNSDCIARLPASLNSRRNLPDDRLV